MYFFELRLYKRYVKNLNSLNLNSLAPIKQSLQFIRSITKCCILKNTLIKLKNINFFYLRMVFT